MCFCLENIWGRIPGTAFPAAPQLLGVPCGSCSPAKPWEGDGETPEARPCGAGMDVVLHLGLELG